MLIHSQSREEGRNHSAKQESSADQQAIKPKSTPEDAVKEPFLRLIRFERTFGLKEWTC